MTILIPDKLRDLQAEHATLLQDIEIETKDLALAEVRQNKDADQRRAIAMKERDLAALESRTHRLQGRINAVVTELNTPQAKATRQKHRDALKALSDNAGAQQVKRAAKIDSAIEALIDMFKERSAAGAKAYSTFTGAVDGLTEGSIGLYESAHGMILPRLKEQHGHDAHALAQSFLKIARASGLDLTDFLIFNFFHLNDTAQITFAHAAEESSAQINVRLADLLGSTDESEVPK